MRSFLQDASYQNSPIRLLISFLREQNQLKETGNYNEWKFVGYVLKIGYDEITIITSDPYKLAVGGVPRNTMLIMVPEILNNIRPHFTLIRVLESAPTPLSTNIQQTYFELQKKSMPELDRFTQSELQWGALKTEILGMYYPSPESPDIIEFSSDINNFVSAHNYRVYAPSDELLDLIINNQVPILNRFPLGNLRMTESRLTLSNRQLSQIPVMVSSVDFRGTRTALFGKTRLGKSNIIKLIAESQIQTTETDRSVGQLIFDINGEYANDNPQDGNYSLASAYPDRCIIYAVNSRGRENVRLLRINFYEYPARSMQILADLLRNDGRTSSIYVRNFTEAELPNIDEIPNMDKGKQRRATRLIQMYWAVLFRAGYNVNERELIKNTNLNFNPNYNAKLRAAVYDNDILERPRSLQEMVAEFDRVWTFVRGLNEDDDLIRSSRGNPLFTANDRAILNFLKPTMGAGAKMIQAYRQFHDRQAGEFTREIIQFLENGQTVILDLGNANPLVLTYFSDDLSRSIFNNQVDRFSNNNLGNTYIQIYFEEAHNLFPRDDSSNVDIYRRLAKEGAKYQIGMVYATQSISSINADLLAQTENFFILHLSSRQEVDNLARLNISYESVKRDILQTRTPGYVRMLTRSHRFVVPVQARQFLPRRED